jgi:protein phosphatase
MPTSVATLYCSNCGAANSEPDHQCHQCALPLVKRYLWVVGNADGLFNPDDTLGEEQRFLFRSQRVVLDTKPGLDLPYLAVVPETAMPYLRLFSYRIHIPQVYAIVPTELDITASGDDGRELANELMLLEQAPLAETDWPATNGSPTQELTRVAVPFQLAWGQASLMRQLNWLWQMIQLWQPLCLEGVASSLLQPDLLRVEGPLLRLLELSSDAIALNELGIEPTLAQLGRLWLRWLPTAHPALKTGLEQLCEQMIAGQIHSPDVITRQLDRWLEVVTQKGESGPAPAPRFRFDVATATDQGPSRKRNEDACFPKSGTVCTDAAEILTIVCDGVGGHAGGDVASSSAIATIQSHLQALPSQDREQLMTELENAIFKANDHLCQQNDAEQRQERQRMGTTVVLAQARQHEIYLAHVGDSRVYWITRSGCYPLTVDDDVASREVRLGYTLYREVLQHPISGSLVQALGMASSETLHPNVTRWLLDEDCVFLLCSDGLSDYDRVEESWRAEILPLLHGQTDLVTVRDRLIELANRVNGHDNVTVSLLHCRVALADTAVPVTQLAADPPPVAQPTLRQPDTSQSGTSTTAPPSGVTVGLPVFSMATAPASDHPAAVNGAPELTNSGGTVPGIRLPQLPEPSPAPEPLSSDDYKRWPMSRLFLLAVLASGGLLLTLLLTNILRPWLQPSIPDPTPTPQQTLSPTPPPVGSPTQSPTEDNSTPPVNLPGGSGGTEPGPTESPSPESVQPSERGGAERGTSENTPEASPSPDASAPSNSNP